MGPPPTAPVGCALSLALLAAVPTATAGPPPLLTDAPELTVHIEATVGDDLQTVTGTISVTPLDGLQLVDPQALLPLPPDDLWIRRSFPGPPETGRIRMIPLPEAGHWRFISVLPRRTDAHGKVPGHGLFEDGSWYPQPLVQGRLPLVDWDARISIPAGSTGVLNSTVLDDHGADTTDGKLHYDGQAERLALAVLPHGRATTWDLPAGQVVIVDDGPRRRRRDRRVVDALAAAWPGPGAPRVVVVEAPARRRLVRPGPGVLFLSDRAFRLTGPLWRYHRAAVERGLLAAGLPITDPWLRGFAAHEVVARLDTGRNPRELLGWLSWLPEIDTLLYDGDLPFYGEVFDEAWPSDPVADDFLDLFSPQTPPAVVAHRIDQRFGDGTAARIADPLLSDIPLTAALAGAGVPRSLFDAWRQAPVEQELRVDVRRSSEGFVVVADRDAGPDAPAEPVVVEIDGEQQIWEAGPGTDQLRIELHQRPRQVQLDPDGDVRQQRAGDRWPRRWTATVSFFPSELAATEGRLSAIADVILRKQYDTRWLFDIGLATDPEDLLRLSLGTIHYRGPLSNRRRRPIRLWAYADLALLDPDFRPTDGATMALGGNIGAAWETRVDRDQPMRGHRLSASVDGGVLPATGDAWGALRTAATGVTPLSGRLAMAGRLRLGLAEGGVEHRLLSLGGSSALRGLPFDAAVGDRLAVGSVEMRWQALRGASIPLPLSWGSDLQLSAGLDAGTMGGARLAADDAPLDALHGVGWALGVGGSIDFLGARPTYGGVTVARPLWTSSAVDGGTAWPEIYLQLDGAF